jgi:ribonuclease D
MNSHQYTKPEMVTGAEDLSRLVARLAGETILAFDLEADSLHHYREKVCLIQIATTREVFLIDPFAVPDISPLAPILLNPSVRKVFHGADYDIRSLDRDFSLRVKNLFDTMIACQFLGEKEVGLAAALRKRFGVELDKKYQKADWSRRPLDPGMVDYAAADTSLLVSLYLQLEEELLARNRLYWVEEESELLSEVRAVDREGEPFYSRFKGASRMDPRTLAVLEELLRFRDEQARYLDRPPFKVLSGETMRALAEKKPLTMQELSGTEGLPSRLLERYGKDILKAVGRGCALPEDRLPRIPRPVRPERDPLKEERLRHLKKWRDGKAGELGIDPGVLVTSAQLDALAKDVPRDRMRLDAVPYLRNWQKRELGEDFLKMLC